MSGEAPSFKPSSASVSGAALSLSRRHDEGLQVSADGRRIADVCGKGHRFDAQQAERPAADLDTALDDRRYGPAGAAELDKKLLREGRAVAGDQRGVRTPPNAAAARS